MGTFINGVIFAAETGAEAGKTAGTGLMDGYLSAIKHSPFDWVILFLSLVFIVVNLYFTVVLIGRRVFKKTYPVDVLKSAYNLIFSASQLLPLLGLLGTVISLLNTFNDFDKGSTQEIIHSFAPALTTTASGIIGLVATLCSCFVFKVAIPKSSKNQKDE